MRLTQPADSLDRGGLGETVRVRLITSGRILPATVVAAGLTENTAE
jgi:flagella basal body P-ring formation protein FlgA